MTAIFRQDGNIVTVGAAERSQYYSVLPAGNYILKHSEMTGFYFETQEPFATAGKVYGDTMRTCDRILQTFMERSVATGVLLTGEKGSGKTLLARLVSTGAALNHSVPTIIITSPFVGDEFNSFIASLHQPCIILFDEFEKVYSDQMQPHILTLLDGVFPSKKLFMLTCNDKYKVNTNMQNRPGRIYYFIDFTGVTEDFIREYCADNLRVEMRRYTENLVDMAGMFGSLNFDMLKAIVEEMNRYGEAPAKAIELLNTKPEFAYAQAYTVEFWKDGKLVRVHEPEWKGNAMRPFKHHFTYTDERKDEDGDLIWENCEISNEHLVSMKGGLTFAVKPNLRIIMKPKLYSAYSWEGDALVKVNGVLPQPPAETASTGSLLMGFLDLPTPRQ